MAGAFFVKKHTWAGDLFDVSVLQFDVFEQVSVTTPLRRWMDCVARSYLLFVLKETQVLGCVEAGDMGVTAA